VISIAAIALMSTTEPVRHSTLILPGILFSAGNQGTSIGGEVSVAHWFNRREPSILGAYAQAEYGTRAPRVGAGIEVAYWLLGCELGWSRRFAGAGHIGTNALHIAPYLGLGFMSLGVRFTQPFGTDDALWGREVAFVLTFKGFKVISGREPDPISMNMPHGRPVRDEDGAVIEPPFATGPALLHFAADEWIARGRQEQASVATFLRLAQELALHSAPSELIADCHRAALDEIAHARFCFARAEEIAGARVVPGDLVVPPPRAIDRATLARECLIDGCEGEGRSADALEVEGLAIMAREERSHAELAARIVAFCSA
jgi:hypothetical protein